MALGLCPYLCGLVASAQEPMTGLQMEGGATTPEIGAERSRLSTDVRDHYEILEQRYRTALEQNPGSVPILDNLATILRDEGKNTAAMHYWQQALRKDPDNQRVQLSVATLQIDMGDLNEAEIALERLIEKDHDFQPAFFALGSVRCRLNDFSSCIAAYRRAVQLDQSDPLARQCLAKALLSQHLYREAIETLKPYATAHPADGETRYLLGVAYRGNSEPELAESELRFVLGSASQPPTLETELGSTLAEEGKMEEALPYLDRAVARNSEDAEAHAHLILALRALHRREDADREASILSRLKQKQIERDKSSLLRSRAKALVESGQPREAKRMYGLAIESSPQDAMLLYERAMVEDQLGEEDGERRDLQEALALLPTLANAHNQLGILEIKSGNMEAAEKELKAALVLEPTGYAALGNLAVAEAHRGNVEQATAYLRAALQINPDYEEGHRNLGVLLVAAGHAQQARQELREALSLDAKDAIARDLLDQIGQSAVQTSKAD